MCAKRKKKLNDFEEFSEQWGFCFTFLSCEGSHEAVEVVGSN